MSSSHDAYVWIRFGDRIAEMVFIISLETEIGETKLYQFDTFSGLHRNSTTLVETCLGIFATGTEILTMGTEVVKKLIQLK
jgi:hypothetical protein